MSERVWITDGSAPVFSDTRRLRAAHRGILGLPVRYEGFVDPSVPRGTASIRGSADDVLFVEAEWYVTFPQGIEPLLADPDRLEGSTPVAVQGLIEGKWMNRLLGTRAWRPASLGNNVIADGPGISTTVGALDDDAAAEVRLEHDLADGGRQTFTASLAELRGADVSGLLRDVLRACREDGERIDGVDLGAIGDSAAVVNDPRRLKAALRPIPIPHRAKERLVRRAILDGLGLPPGTPARLVARDAVGAVVGEASLEWRRGEA